MAPKRSLPKDCDAYSSRKSKRSKSRPENESESASTVHSAVLLTCYKKVQTLRAFLLDQSPSTLRTSRRRIASFDSVSKGSFLDTCLVGFIDEPSPAARQQRSNDFTAFRRLQPRPEKEHKKLRNGGPSCSMREVLDFVVWSLFKNTPINSGRPRHLLCHGLQKAAGLQDKDTRLQDYHHFLKLVVNHPNQCFHILTSPPWTEILPVIGDGGDLMIANLLIECGLFLTLDASNERYFQLCGTPMSDLVPPFTNLDSQPTNRERSKATPPKKICFVRNRILYARPSINSQGVVSFGLKHKHALRRYHDSANKNHTIYVLKYIFPRQFRLHNVFTSIVDTKETDQPFKDYTSREHELQVSGKKSQNWVPRRLRGHVLKLVQNLQQNQRRCPYSQLLRHHCPIFHVDNDSQMPKYYESCDDSMTLDNDRLNAHESFLQHASAAHQVSAFCQSTIVRCLPKYMFGFGIEGRQSWRTLLKAIDRFIRMRKFETMSLHDITQNIRLKHISWLTPRELSSTQNIGLRERNKRLELLHELIYYLFDSFLIPLIRSNFYVTESGPYRNKLFFFRHDIWRKLSEPSLATLRMGMYEAIKPGQLRRQLNSRTLGYSQVRILPKERGIRLITNLRRKVPTLVGNKRVLGSSINAQLAPLFNLLNHERMRSPACVGSSIFSIGDLRPNLSRFRSMVKPDTTFYFVKVDVQSCFDTIPQSELLARVAALVQQTQYRMIKYAEISMRGMSQKQAESPVRTRYLGIARPADDTPVFSPSVANDVGLKKHNTVFTDTGNAKIWHKNELLELLQEHVQNNIVKIGKKHYRQISGIPQGSVLSTLLCSIFYTGFENERLAFLNPASSMFTRLIDDFLLITTDETEAHRFLRVMERGSEKYGISISPTKTLVNFVCKVDGRKIPIHHGSPFFPYCGIAIDMQSLQVSKQYEKKDFNVANGLTTDLTSRPGLALRRKIISSLKLQMHEILLDPALNKERQTISTMTGILMEVAMKMHQYISSMPKNCQPSTKLLINIIEELIAVGRNMWRSRSMRNMQTPQLSPVTKSQVSWITAVAFEHILSPKQTRYNGLLTWLTALKESTKGSASVDTRDLTKLVQSTAGHFCSYIY